MQVGVFSLQVLIDMLFDSNYAAQVRGAGRRFKNMLAAGVLYDLPGQVFAFFQHPDVFFRQPLVVTAVLLKSSSQALLDRHPLADASRVTKRADKSTAPNHEHPVEGASRIRVAQRHVLVYYRPHTSYEILPRLQPGYRTKHRKAGVATESIARNGSYPAVAKNDRRSCRACGENNLGPEGATDFKFLFPFLDFVLHADGPFLFNERFENRGAID